MTPGERLEYSEDSTFPHATWSFFDDRPIARGADGLWGTLARLDHTATKCADVEARTKLPDVARYVSRAVGATPRGFVGAPIFLYHSHYTPLHSRSHQSFVR